MNRIIQNYKSRQTILDLLKKQGYNVDEYEGFSLNEIDTMTRNNTLDMFVTTSKVEEADAEDENFKKMYIKYEEFANTSRVENAINDLFDNAHETKYQLRSSQDTLLIISNDDPNDKMQNYLATLYETQQRFVTIINIHRLLFNILEHDLQPKEISILTPKQKAEFIKKFHIKNYTMELPEISRFDPLALVLFLKPGEICRFVRDSPVAITSEYYRVCV